MDVREKVFYSMVNASCPILEMQSKKVSLEEIFLELTESEKKIKMRQEKNPENLSLRRQQMLRSI